MNIFSKYFHLEDLKRIDGGYMPKRHFISLYIIITIFMVLKLFVYRAGRRFVEGFFNDGKFHKKHPMLPYGVYDHTR